MSFVLKTGAIIGTTILINKFLAGFVICTGPSMEPTLRTGNVLLTDLVSPRLGLIDKGDVVIARTPKERTRVCKRVVAKSGETVKFNDKLYVVPEGFVWLEGDNKSNSNDSRKYGPVPNELICSRCLFRIWPDINLFVLSSNPRRTSLTNSDSSEKEKS